MLSRARRALALGCDGVISSGLEAKALRGELGERLLIVSPGIRPVENRPVDDQKRVVASRTPSATAPTTSWSAARSAGAGSARRRRGRAGDDRHSSPPSDEVLEQALEVRICLIPCTHSPASRARRARLDRGRARRAVPWRAVGAGLALRARPRVVLLLQAPGRQGHVPGAERRACSRSRRRRRRATALVFGYLGGGTATLHGDAPGRELRPRLPRAAARARGERALGAALLLARAAGGRARASSWLLERTMGVGGVVGLSTAANVFVGMVEAPLVVKPYLARVSRGELFAIMACGMASIAGTVHGAVRERSSGARVPDASAICSSLRSWRAPPRRSPSRADGAARGRSRPVGELELVRGRDRRAWTRSRAARSTARSCS